MDSAVPLPNSAVANQRMAFSLRGLFIAVTFFAIFFGVWNLENVRWTDAIRAVITLLILWGFVAQVFDLRQAARSMSHPHLKERVAWETGWRIVLGVLLVVFLVETILQQMFPQLLGTSELLSLRLQAAPEVGWLLLVLLTYWEARRQRQRPMTWFRGLVSLGGVFAGCGLVLYLIYDWSIIGTLVQMAIQGVVLAQPTRRNGVVFMDYQFHTLLLEQLRDRVPVAMVGWAAVTISGWICLCCRSQTWRWIWGTLSVLGLLALAVANVWAHRGMGQVFYLRPPNPDLQSGFYPANALLLALIVAAAGTIVFLRDFADRPEIVRRFPWRKPFGGYLHEWSLTFLLLLAMLLPIYYQDFEATFQFSGRLSMRQYAEEILYGLIHFPRTMLTTLLLLTILGALYRLWRPIDQREHTGTELTPLRWRRAIILGPFLFTYLWTMLFTFYWLSWVIRMEIR